MRYVPLFSLVVLLSAAAASPSWAQTPEMTTKRDAEARIVYDKVQGGRVAVESKVTKGAPYSGEAVTESLQSLADGNRIVTKSTTRIYRDADGRVRREQLNPGGTDVVSISITDPVAGTSYVLDPVSHVAYQGGLIFTPSVMTATTMAGEPGGPVVIARTAERGAVVSQDSGRSDAEM